MPVSTHESITATHLREAATWVAEATLLLRRSGVTGADDIAQTLAASVPKIESLSANPVAKPPCVGAAPRSAPAAGILPLFAREVDHA